MNGNIQIPEQLKGVIPHGAKLLGYATLDSVVSGDDATFNVPENVRGFHVVAKLVHVDGTQAVVFYRKPKNDTYYQTNAQALCTPQGEVEYAPPEEAMAAVQEALRRLY